MANFVLQYQQDLRKKVEAHIDGGLVFSADNNSVQVAVEVLDGGQAATLTGNVVGFAIRANNTTVALTGTRSGNICGALLPEACFAYAGPLIVTLRLVSGTTKTTLLRAVYQVELTSSGTQVDPGSVIPDISNLLAQLEAMEEATDAANAAASKAVRYDTSQSLSDAQKAQARTNIDAAAVADVEAAVTSLNDAIYQELNATQTKPASGNAIITEEFHIIKNQAYLLTLETAGTATITTRLTNLGETVEQLYAGPAVTNQVIVPAYDANYFRVVGTKDFTVSIKTLNSKTAYDLALANEQDITLINSKTPLYTTNYAGLINSTSVVSDLDAIDENISYRMNYAVGSTSIPAHTPYGSAWGSATLVYFQSIVKTTGAHSAGDLQLFIGSDAMYVRSYTASWTAWTKVYGIDTYAKNNSALITTTATVSDLDDISSNISYRLNYALNSTSIPANTPYGNAWKSESVAYFQSIVKTPGTNSAGDFQLFIGSDGIYIRNYTVSWTAWRKLYDGSNGTGREYVVDINGTGDYTSLCACIDVATEYANSVIHVKRGTYNAIAEMLALKGNNYFDDFATSTDQIYVRNGLKVICEPGTVLTAHYTGSNAIVKSYYAPINFRNSDGYIEGLEIDASNCRYCIHDDQWTYTEPYKHTLKNCRLIIDNSGNTDWDRRLAFGGGLGVNGYIVFDGCYFKSVGLDGTAYSGYGSAGYHNSPSADAQSAIYVTNCYFADNSTFRLTRHGSSTKMTRAFVSGCSLGREMELTYEQTSSTPINCEIIDCNNIVRA